MLLCIIKGCDNIQHYNGFCQEHYDFYFKSVYGENRTSHPLYSVRRGIIYRCINKKNSNYKYYGGRGIKVSDRRSGPDGFKNFICDMGDRPKGFSVDRIDCNGPYSPENCKWSDCYEQQANTRNQVGNDTGVIRRKQSSKFQSMISFKNTRVSLGLHQSKDRAIEIRKKAEIVCRENADKDYWFVILTLNDLKREYRKKYI